MNIHENARLTPRGRELLVRQIMSGQTVVAAAGAANVCPRTARKWLARFLAEGVEGLKDRSSRPHRLHRPTPPEIVERVEALRRQRWTGRQIAAELDISPATVSRILKRLGLNRIAALEPAEPVRRYERDAPGELIHIDIKKLGRFERVGHRITGDRQKGVSRGAGSGVRPRLDRRCLAPRLLADPTRREEGECRRLPARRRRILCQPRRYGGAGDDRQRILLSLEGLPQGLPRSRPPAHQDQALYAEDQRQGGALHPDRPPRVGLCAGLSELQSTRTGVAGLAPPIQLASPARQPTIKAADQQTPTQPGQPGEAPHLAARSRSRQHERVKRRRKPHLRTLDGRHHPGSTRRRKGE